MLCETFRKGTGGEAKGIGTREEPFELSLLKIAMNGIWYRDNKRITNICNSFIV